ncbi:DUF1302 domain-containing protein [Nevskia ramosa]|uniref:DUF1302 domain-containing protein n=1 Tax=Nevskia ramosa TaxID=64002 RepID=UPI0003B52337|nr:DUF1302 family protein [Nevskia ramosa]
MASSKFAALAVAVAVGAALPMSATASEFDFNFGEQDFNAVLNQTLTAGVAFRIEERDSRLIGKSNIDPNVCTGVYQLCQGLNRTQTYPAEKLRRSPGAASMNFDDGDLNFDRGDITQSPVVWTHDLKIESGKFGFFYRGRAIYDPSLYHGQVQYRNRITSANVNSVGTAEAGNRTSNRYFSRTYGPGGAFSENRNEQEAQQIGLRYDFLDTNFFGSIPIPGDRELQFRLGRQTVQWGESTVAILNSINQAQPINANNFFRSGNGLLEDLYIPVNMFRISTNIVDGLSVEGYYQFESRHVEIPTPGTFNSFVDLGTTNLRNFVNASFGSAADDPESLAGGMLDNPLTAVTPTALIIPRLPDRKASDQGQYGFKLSYYADWLNNGTELSGYFMNYHSQLPYVSTYATNASCARREGSAIGIDARNTTEFLQSCPNLPIALGGLAGQAALGLDTLNLLAQSPLSALDIGTDLGAFANLLLPRPGMQISDAVGFDTARVMLEYPEDRKLFGFSFNTTYGDYSYQGEIAYRPNLPLQVALVDLAFASFGPSLTRCHDINIGCQGTTNTVAFTENGGNQYSLYPSNNFVDANGNNPYPDNLSLIVGSVPGSARSFPNFITPYRGITLGENAPNSYIQGYIPGKVLQYTFGATRVLSGTENWIGADQVILLYEVAATHVLNLPKFNQLQIEGPGAAYTHASAGADGSGADGSRLACSTNPSCSIGPDGLRFNPYQAKRNQFANSFAGGYRMIGRISYESVLPGISIQPLLIFQHDIYNNSPGPGANFVEGRIQLNSLFEIRYEKSTSLTVTYNLYTRGGANNQIRDRDNIGFFLRYQF